MRLFAGTAILLLLSSCGEPEPEPGLGSHELPLTLCRDGKCYPCNHQTSSAVPDDHTYVITTFGGGSDTQSTACGGRQADAEWYYAASKQRFGCGARLRVVNPKTCACVVVQVADLGPDICVEQAAGYPVLDASPLVTRHLFGASSAGWSEGVLVQATTASAGAPLGPCTAEPDSCDPQSDAGTGDPGGSPDGGNGSDPDQTGAQPFADSPDRHRLMAGGCQVAF